MAYLRLECWARAERVKTAYMGLPCPGYRSRVEGFQTGGVAAFQDCVSCTVGSGDTPGHLEATGV